MPSDVQLSVREESHRPDKSLFQSIKNELMINICLFRIEDIAVKM